MRISLKLYMDTLGYKLDKLTLTEIGVYKGDNAIVMLEKCPKINKLYLIDDYNAESKWFTDEKGESMSKEKGDIFFEDVKKRFQGYGNKVSLMRKTSLEASKDFPDEFFDYCYIDGGHNYENVKQDLNIWYPKVKFGGMFAGHDSHYPDVTKAIVEFAVMKGLTIFHVGIIKNEYIPAEIDINEFADWWIFKVPLFSPEKVAYWDLEGLHIMTSNFAKNIYPDNRFL